MTSETPPVILLHGLARTQLSMAGMARFLKKNGFETWLRTYPSRRLPVAELATLVAGWIQQSYGDRPVHIVTHSMGGLLVRHMAAQVPMARVVMLAPPNQGSALAGALQDFGPFSLLYGPAGQDVSAAKERPLPMAPTAVIAGTQATAWANPVSWLSAGLQVFGADRPNDGTVAVDETHLPGMDAFAEVHTSHTWIMNNAQVRALTLAFLRDGAF